MPSNYSSPQKVFYVLPHPNFFSQLEGIGGHIAHAMGGVVGWRTNGAEVTAFVAGPDQLFTAQCNEIVELPAIGSRLRWNNLLVDCVASSAHQNNADLVYLRYSGAFAPWLPRLKKKLVNIPLILEVNSLLSQRTRLAFLLDRRALRAASDIITISKEQAEIIRRIGGAPLHDRIAVMPNAVDHTRFNNVHSARPIDSPTAPAKRPFRIGYVGVLKPDYGIELLLDAFRTLRGRRNDVELMICGAGPARQELQNSVTTVPGVIFEGAVPFDSVPTYLSSFDIAVYSTTIRNIYQSPVKLFEYMAAGCAIVSAATPVTREVLGMGQYGVLHEIGNKADLVESLNKLLDDEQNRRLLGSRAREQAIAEHTWNSRYAEYIKRLNQRGLL